MMSVIKFRSLFLALLVSFGFLLVGTPTAYAQTEPAQTEHIPKCETPTVKGDPDCWLKAENHDNCYFWNNSVSNEETVTWSGQCRAGKPDGRGKETWGVSANGRTHTSIHIGSYVDGKKHGRWQYRWASGREDTGSYVNGKEHGRWQYRWADGSVDTGPYVNGKKHGEWVEEDEYDRDTGSYVNGKKHGQWKEIFITDDSRSEETGSYVDGKRHGQWKDTYDHENFRIEDIGSYVDGKKHGRWIRTNHNYRGNRITTTTKYYENGKEQ